MCVSKMDYTHNPDAIQLIHEMLSDNDSYEDDSDLENSFTGLDKFS